jgi:hypothetical protein
MRKLHRKFLNAKSPCIRKVWYVLAFLLLFGVPMTFYSLTFHGEFETYDETAGYLNKMADEWAQEAGNQDFVAADGEFDKFDNLLDQCKNAGMDTGDTAYDAIYLQKEAALTEVETQKQLLKADENWTPDDARWMAMVEDRDNSPPQSG